MLTAYISHVIDYTGRAYIWKIHAENTRIVCTWYFTWEERVLSSVFSVTL